MTDKQIVLIAGAVCVAFGLIFLVVRIPFVRRAVTSEGTVTDLESHHDSDGGRTYSRWAPELVLLVGVGLLTWGFFFQRDDGSAAETAGNASSLARTLPSGQTRISVVNQSDSQVLTAECISIRDTQQGTTRQVELRLQGDKSLTLKATPYTGPKAYTVPIGASVRGTIFEGAASPSGAVVFSGNGQNGVVNFSALPLSVSGNWDCTDVELQRS